MNSIINKLAEKLVIRRQKIDRLKNKIKKLEEKETGTEEALFKQMLQAGIKSFKYLDDMLLSLSTKKHYFVAGTGDPEKFFKKLIQIKKGYLIKKSVSWQSLQTFMKDVEERAEDKKSFLHNDAVKEFKEVKPFLNHTERKTISIRGLKTKKKGEKK